VTTVLVVLSLTLCSIAFIFLLVVGNAENNGLPAIHQKAYAKIVKVRGDIYIYI
jgi:hypothetical protein